MVLKLTADRRCEPEADQAQQESVDQDLESGFRISGFGVPGFALHRIASPANKQYIATDATRKKKKKQKRRARTDAENAHTKPQRRSQPDSALTFGVGLGRSEGWLSALAASWSAGGGSAGSAAMATTWSAVPSSRHVTPTMKGPAYSLQANARRGLQ
eukprot:803210-Rhodomonas_salina.1